MAEQYLEMTWARVLTIWWAYLWRAVLAGFIVGLVIGFIIGVMAGVMGTYQTNPAGVGSIISIFGALAGAVTSVYMLKRVLAKQFKDFRIVLIPNE